VDPLPRALEILQLESSRWLLIATHDGEQRIRAEPFDEIELELGALWG
jgi:hypothetical protein